jgi:ribosomal protein S12 methylthiotransferase accessory factor
VGLIKGYTAGTHRLVAPETTLERITPHLLSFGITRCADVTGLDRIGIPVTCAIRPASRTVQVSNGKGLRKVDAKVSALMEAIELSCAESPSSPFRRASAAEMSGAGECFAAPASLPRFNTDLWLDERSRLDWIEADELLSGQASWVPASAAYYLPERSVYRWNSNGLASGNHLVEATLHALYEVLERHMLSWLVKGSSLSFKDADVFDVDSVSDDALGALIASVRAAGLGLVLLRVHTELPVHTFMAVLCDPKPFGLSRRVDPGYGTHLNPAIAASRAITEAAQGRLTVIHGSREDLSASVYLAGPHNRLYDFYTHLKPRGAKWTTLSAHDGPDLEEDLETLLSAVRSAGLPAVYRVRMEGLADRAGVSVTKVLVPGALNTFPV